MKDDGVGLAIEKFFVKDLAFGQVQRRFGKNDSRARGQLKVLPAKHQLAQTEDAINQATTNRDAQETSLKRFSGAGRSVQSGNRERTKKAHDTSSAGNFVRNAEVLDIDECGHAEPGKQNAVNQGKPR